MISVYFSVVDIFLEILIKIFHSKKLKKIFVKEKAADFR